MQAFLAILRYDLGQLSRSWLMRIWVLLLAVPAGFLVVVSATEKELASETLALYLGAVLAPLSALAVAVITSSAVAGETATVADSIMSRSVTRSEYLWAKIISRLGVTLLVYGVIAVPFAYLVTRYATHDTSLAGVAGGLLMVGALLVFLAALGITLSTVMRNVLVAVLVLLSFVLTSGVVLQFLGLSWMSTTAVIEGLPETFRGRTPGVEQLRVLGVFSGLTVIAIITSLWGFRHRDL
jgi:ABC-type transport system involved in multi-copper enzyme maturation permease subunit